MNEQGIDSTPLTREMLIPSDWFSEQDEGVIWISSFYAMGLDPSRFVNGPIIIDLESTRILIFYGHVNYVDVINSIRSTVTPQIVSQANDKVSPEGGYLLIIQRFDQDNPSESEIRIKNNIQLLSGLFAAILGQNIVYQRFFDNVVNLNNNNRSVFTSSHRNPLSLSGPNVSNQQIQFLEDAHKSMMKLPDFERNRVQLSLRWYFESLHSSGVDIFLKNWFAIEALGMSEKENINPLNDSLASAYGISFHDAREKFGLGKIYGFRNRIVHRGEIYPIHANLSDYVEALYIDVLFERLGLKCEKRAEEVKNRTNFDLEALIHSE